MAYKVVMTVDLGSTEIEERALEAVGGQVAVSVCTTEEQLIESCRDCDGVLVGANSPVTARVIDSLERCRVLSRLGIGYSNIDVKAATAKRIAVTYVPDYCVGEVSDHALTMLLALARAIVPLNQSAKSGRWKKGFQELKQPMRRLSGQTLGIVGLGKIGQSLAAKAQALGLRTIAFDPYLSSERAQELGVELVEMDFLLWHSDYVSLHAPLTETTKKLFSLAALKKMKPTAYLINSSRGGLVDERALYVALTEGLIAGAGIDVTDPEPPQSDNPLFRLDNVLITPHVSYYSEEADVELRRRSAEAVADVLQGRRPDDLVNPDVMAEATLQ